MNAHKTPDEETWFHMFPRFSIGPDKPIKLDSRFRARVRSFTAILLFCPLVPELIDPISTKDVRQEMGREVCLRAFVCCCMGPVFEKYQCCIKRLPYNSSKPHKQNEETKWTIPFEETQESCYVSIHMDTHVLAVNARSWCSFFFCSEHAPRSFLAVMQLKAQAA